MVLSMIVVAPKADVPARSWRRDIAGMIKPSFVVRLSSGCRLHRGARQVEARASAGSTGLLIRGPRRSNVLHAAAGRIEDDELILAHAAGLSAGRERGKVGMDLIFRHDAGAQGVVEIAAGSASLQV